MREELPEGVDTGSKLEAIGAKIYYKHLLRVRREGSSSEEEGLRRAQISVEKTDHKQVMCDER